MFELDVALKYLLPKWKQLSVSIITLISTLVISLVVWLILVFFSVTNGLETIWVDKLITLTAPIRITPTPAYYDSYYYLVDSSKESAGFKNRSIREKLAASENDLLTSLDDEPFEYEGFREERDLVKELFALLSEIPHVESRPYESAVAMLKLRLVRGGKASFMNQTAYFGSFDPKNRSLAKALTPLDENDVEHLIAAASFEKSGGEALQRADFKEFQQEIKRITDSFQLSSFSIKQGGLTLPPSSLPKEGSLLVATVRVQGKATEHWTAFDERTVKQLLTALREKDVHLEKVAFKDLKAPLFLAPFLTFQGKLDEESLSKARSPNELKVIAKVSLQGNSVSIHAPLVTLSIDAPLPRFEGEYLSRGQAKVSLSADPKRVAILLPKSWRESGVLAGDDGLIAYNAVTATGAKEQLIPVVVTGFYDQGVVPIGGRFIFAPEEIVSEMASSFDQSEGSLAAGVNVRFDDLSKTDEIKREIQSLLRERGLSDYWNVESYKDYSFTRDLFMQLASEKNLFGVISLVIILVACSNIISMLIILVNDKKREIGILRSMGATSTSIVTIFGALGFVMGLIGTAIGFLFALLTLYYLHPLVAFMGRMQGHEMFNAHYFGETLPNQLDQGALLFVFTATLLIACLSGLVPAFKASRVQPSHILKRGE